MLRNFLIIIKNLHFASESMPNMRENIQIKNKREKIQEKWKQQLKIDVVFDVLPWEKIFVTNKSSEIAPYDQNNMNIIRNKCIIRSKQHRPYHAMYVNKKNNHDVTRDVSYVLVE